MWYVFLESEYKIQGNKYDAEQSYWATNHEIHNRNNKVFLQHHSALNGKRNSHSTYVKMLKHIKENNTEAIIRD